MQLLHLKLDLKKIITLGVLIITLSSTITAQIVNIPDINFKNYLVTNFDTNGDDEIQTTEASVVTNMIYVPGLAISDLTGIEYFYNVTEIYCQNNNLTSIDISANTDLTYLNCYNNDLTSLDVSSNILLEELNCSVNQLNTLNVSVNPLISLNCTSNQLTSLNVSSNNELEVLTCSSNMLTTLYLPPGSTLKHVDCSDNQFTSLNLSSNPALLDLNCEDNQLTNLNLSANTALFSLTCENNLLTNLDISANVDLNWVSCDHNQLTSINFPLNGSLHTIHCGNNLFTSLHVPANSSLSQFYCSNCPLISLDISENTALTALNCSLNQLTYLNVYGDSLLSFLDCSYNQLVNLDVSSNAALANFVCNTNQLVSLNVSANAALNYFRCYTNQLNSLNVQNGNNINLDFFAQGNPGLTCIQVDDSTYSATNWATRVDSWANFSLACATTISGNVKDAGVNFATGVLALNNCTGCEVELYQGTSLVASQTTTGSGYFNFTGLTSNNYKIVAKKTIGSVSAIVTNVNVDPGDSIADIIIPCALVIQANSIIDSLESRVFTTAMFYNMTSLDVNASGYDESNIQGFVNDALTIQGNNENIVNSLSRLLIAQRALKEFSDDASIMISESVVSSFDLGISLYNIMTISKKVDEIATGYLSILKKLKTYTISLGLKTIKYVVVQALNCVEDNDIRVKTKEKFEASMDVLIDIAEAEDPDDYNQTVATALVREHITTQLTPYIYSNVFVPATDENVNQTFANASTNNYSGTFEEVYEYTIHNSANNSLLDIAHQKTNAAQAKIENYRTISSLSSEAAELALIAAMATSSFDGGTMATVAAILSGVKVGMTASALGTGVYRVSKIKSELPEATENSFLRNQAGQPYTREFLTSRSLNLNDAVNDYNNYLAGIQTNIINGQRSLAISKIDTLLVLDSLLQDAQINSLAPIYAAAPYGSSVITDFDSLYNFTVINTSGMSMFKRQAVNYSLIGYILDSTSTNIIDSLNVNITETIGANVQVITDIENMNDSIAGISVPAHVFVTSYSVPKPMQPSSSYPVSISYKNIGTMDAADVYAKLTLIDGFTTTQDSVFIGSVATGATGTVTFNVQTPAYDTISYLTVAFYSPNTTSDGMGTSVVVKNMVSVPDKGLLSSGVSVYPNPFNSEATILFEEEQKNTSIRIIDVMGKEVRKMSITGRSLLIEKGMLSPGIYFVQIRDKNKNLVNKKIIVQ